MQTHHLSVFSRREHATCVGKQTSLRTYFVIILFRSDSVVEGSWQSTGLYIKGDNGILERQKQEDIIALLSSWPEWQSALAQVIITPTDDGFFKGNTVKTTI